MYVLHSFFLQKSYGWTNEPMNGLSDFVTSKLLIAAKRNYLCLQCPRFRKLVCREWARHTTFTINIVKLYSSITVPSILHVPHLSADMQYGLLHNFAKLS